MKSKCVYKEQCLSYPATKFCILTPAHSRPVHSFKMGGFELENFAN